MFAGCGTALVTPFRRDSSLDEAALRKLVRRQIDAGIDFLVPCGTTGENPTLTRHEHLRVVEIAMEESARRVPVLAGAGGYNTAEIVGLARELQSMRVDGILSVTPYYNKPTPDGLYQHYKAIASAVSLPLVVYNVPRRTGTNIDTATLKKLVEIDNIIGIKEASGDLSQVASMIGHLPEAFLVLSGDDALALPIIALGGRGLISVASNEIPAEMTQLVRYCLEENFERARYLQQRLLPLMEVNFIESSPIPVKAAMAAMGLLEPVWRLPLCPPRPENEEKIRGVLECLGLVGERHVARAN
jgi:4-hydroxy-tetrahydrodipicolinate synthase